MVSLLERLVPSRGDVLADKYLLGEELGRGGFGVVFRATNTSLDQDVAVKLLLPHVVTNPALFDRFAREVFVVKGLRHPNTIRVFDYAQTDAGLPFYVMEYVPGRSLVEVLRLERTLSAARTQRIAVQMLKSLAEAHANGIVHRDLKPGNVMLCEIHGEQDFVKILDFGIAKALMDPGVDMPMTQTGLVLGTPQYMSPEQAAGRRDIDGRSDLFAMGLIMSECLGGRPVTEDHSPMQIIQAHASSQPLPFPKELKKHPLWPVIHRATAKKRKERYANAEEMRAALERLTDLPEKRTTDLLGTSPKTPLATPRPSAVAQTPTPKITPDPRLKVGEADPDARTVAALGSTIMVKARSWLPVISVVIFIGAALGGLAFFVFGVDKGSSTSDSSEAVFDNERVTERANQDGTTIPTGSQSAENPNAPLGGPTLVDGGLAELMESIGERDTTASQEPVEGTALANAVLIGMDRVRMSVPSTHLVRFDGTPDVRVTLGDEVLGVTPFEGLLPNVNREAELLFERSGYVSTTESVSFDEPVVSVTLVRRPAESSQQESEPSSEPESSDESSSEATPDNQTGTDELPFGTIRIRENQQ